MTTHCHAVGNALDREVCRWKPQKYRMDVVTIALEGDHPGCKGSARQRGLEGEGHALPRQFLQATKHHTSRRNRDALGVEGRQAAGDRVSVHELGDAECGLE